MYDDIKQHFPSKVDEDIQLFFEAEDERNQTDVVESDYVAEYHNLLNLSRREIINQNQLSQMFMKRGIKYDPTTLQEEIEINIQEYSNNYETIKLNVKYGHFRTTFSIINVDQQSPLRFFGDSIAGSFGQIYKYCINQTIIAIKSIKIEQSKFEKTFRQIIKEYFFIAIASVLKVGPKEIPIFGFEIVIFSDSFNFAMEYCEIGSLRKNEVIDLKDKLYLLHLLQIVHLDIKPQNIGYSHAFDGYIFIDFGLSRMIKQTIGKKSMTGFVGSMNYCSPQMLDLFDMVGSKFVDLYYCDAYALNKSINSLKPEQSLKDQDLVYQLINSKKFDYQGLIPTEIMLKVKWALFELSTNINFQTQILSKYQKFVRKNTSQLNHFVSVLPQTLQLIKYFNKFLKKDESMEEQASLQPFQTVHRKKVQNQQAPQLFEDRYIKLQRINEPIEIESHLKNIIQIEVLFDKVQVKKYRIGIYKLALAQYIRINSWNKDFQRKLQVCSIFNQVQMKIKKLSPLQIYKKTVQFQFLSSLNTKEDENFYILKNIIETVAILQIVPQQTFINSYVTVLSLDLPFVKKMILVIEFITALQFIKYKYKKTYNYKKIKQIFFELLNRYLDENKEIFVDQYEQELIRKLKYIISSKIETNEQNINTYSETFKAEYSRFPFQLKDLNSLLIRYIYYDLMLSQLERNYELPKHYVELLLTMINKQNHYCERFGYLEFALFEFAWTSNQIYYISTIYQIFQSEFCFFDEHRFIDIYLFHKLINIKKYLTKELLEKRKEESHSNEGDNEYQQIFELLDVAVKNNDNFHRYLGFLLFNSPQISSSNLCSRYIDKLISNNQQKILQLSNQFNHYKQKTHYLNLKFEIRVICHIFQFMSSYYKLSPQFWIETLSTFMQKCDAAANKITCFECKVTSMLEINQIYVNYLNYQNKKLESFFTTLDILVFHLKYKQLIHGTFVVMVPLIRRWCQYGLVKKYNLQGFLYEFIKIIKHHYFCLVEIKEYNIFLNLYIYIALRESQEEMVDFLLKICKVLAQMKSINYIDNFYNSTLHLIEMNYNSDHLESFTVYHGRIIVSLLSLNLTSYPYISLYFTALFEMRINAQLQTKILKAISLAITSIDQHSRKIILNNYFEYFAHYLSIPARKKKYALSQHLKYSSSKFNFQLVLKIKLEMKDKSSYIQRKVKKLKQYIRAFHKNLNNIV